MVFNPELTIGQTLKNADIVDKFKCGNMGGMRRSKKTNTLVIVSDYTKGLYQDKWIAGVLHYTGMGKSGDQDIYWAQNATLANCSHNGVDVHLFEVIKSGEYIYCGIIELVENPYIEKQPDEDGKERNVWMFPVRPVPENNVIKPTMFVFDDMNDYRTRGKNVDAEYAKMLTNKKKSDGISHVIESAIPKPEEKIILEIPENIIGKKVRHKAFGIGTITGICGASINVNFEKVGVKKMGYEFCLINKMMDFID